jgi:hypothetical protein
VVAGTVVAGTAVAGTEDMVAVMGTVMMTVTTMMMAMEVVNGMGTRRKR